MAFFGNITGKVNIDGSGANAGLVGVEKRLQQFGRSVQRAGAMIGVSFGVAAIKSFTNATIAAGAKISELSKRTGISAKALQELQYAAEQDGASLEMLVKTIERLAKNQAMAVDGSERQAKAFERFGVSAAELKTLAPDQLFLRLSRAVKDGVNAQREQADVLLVMGETAGELIPAMKSGFADTAAEAEKLGIAISDINTVKLKEMSDELTKISAKAKRAGSDLLVLAAAIPGQTRDLFNMGLGGAAQFLGTLAGGGSLKDALASVSDNAKEIIDKRIAEERRIAAKAAGLGGSTPTAEDQAAAATAVKAVSQQLKGAGANELQRIGAFAGKIDPTQQKMERNISSIAANTEKIVKAVGDGMLYGRIW